MIAFAKALLALTLVVCFQSVVSEQDVEALRAIADEGDPLAQIELGKAYYFGRGIPTNYMEAMRWYRVAADHGNAKAQKAVGYMYDYGEGVKRDSVKALRWYGLAAQQGDPEAQFLLGLGFWVGVSKKFFPKNRDEATAWFTKAADQGNACAQLYLSKAWGSGHGAPKNSEEEWKWLRMSADQGNKEAARGLALSYYFGTGPLQKSDEEAFFWFLVAGPNVLDKGERKKMQKVEERLSRTDVLAIRDRAADWEEKLEEETRDIRAERLESLTSSLDNQTLCTKYAGYEEW